LTERGKVRNRRARAVVANLPRKIAERELALIQKKLSWPLKYSSIEEVGDAQSPGNYITIEIESDNAIELFTGFGERGVAAEEVADKAAQQARRYLASEAAAGEYLADQLLVPMAIAGGGAFTALPPSRHTTTNIEVIKQFLDLEITSKQMDNRVWRIELAS
jgi:RNA 3'-terminal phosphate cyclase (ATP)